MRQIKGFVLAALIGGLAAFSAAQADDEAPASAPAAAPAAGSAALPDLNADDYFEGAEGGTFGRKVAKLLPASKRVAIAGFRVVFVVQDTVSAQVRGSYLPGRDTTGAHASMTVDLKGVDYATMQAITEKAYATFIAQLTAAGREIVPQDQVQPLYAQLELAKTSPQAPYSKEHNGHTGVVFSPAGIPLWWSHADVGWGDQGIISQGNYKKFGAISKDLNAFVIAPTIIVDFASMESSGNHSSLLANEASVGAHLQMGLNGIDTQIVHATEIRYGQVTSGEAAYIRTTKRFTVPAEFGTMEKVSENKTTGFMAVLTGSSKSKSTSNANTDNARYSAAASEVIAQGTGALAKFFQQHSP